MNRNLRSACVLLTMSFFALGAFAGASGPAPTTTITKKGRDDNKVFVGLNYNWGVREGLTAVAGFRWAKVKDNDRVRGGLVDLTFPITGASFGLGELHVKGFDGNRSAQAEAGVGYGFQAGAFLVNGAVRVPFATAGADYLFGKGWQPYLGVSSLGRAKRPLETSTTTCPPGSTLDPGGASCTFDNLD